jgi:hypothetical protein
LIAKKRRTPLANTGWNRKRGAARQTAMRIDLFPRAAGLAVAALLFTSLTACARTDNPVVQTSPGASTTPDGSGTSGTVDQTVVVERTGGIAGVQDIVTVEPDGHWTRGSRRSSAGNGQLSDDQRSRLRALATSPKLRDEATRKVSTAFVCSDAFQYTVTVGDTKVRYEECGTNSTPETASQIATLVMSASGVR